MKKYKFTLLLLFTCVVTVLQAQEAKYVFFFIGDGMGLNQISATEMYLAEQQGFIGTVPLCFTQFPVTGLVKTYSKSNAVTDSSAAGTALATGHKTANGVLSMDSTRTMAFETIAQKAKKAGKTVGIVSTASIDHATPAAFYAHVPSRNMYYAIGMQLAASGFDFFAGGRFLQPVNPQNKSDKDIYQVVTEAGYTVVESGKEYANRKNKAEKMIFIQPENKGMYQPEKGRSSFPFAIDRKDDDLTLLEITEAAIDFLSRKNDGFFLMVEGGAIDWACHSNDAATVFAEVLDFDKAVSLAYEFYLQKPDSTLIIVTADHETGGMAMGNSDYTLNLSILSNQQISEAELSVKMRALRQQYGLSLTWLQMRELLKTTMGFWQAVQLSEDEEKSLLEEFQRFRENTSSTSENEYFVTEEMAVKAKRILNVKSKIGWTTPAHSGAMVPVFAIGVECELFSGFMENTNIPQKIEQITKYGVEK